MKLAYFSYPYSDNPRKRTEEIKQKVRQILKLHSDIVPLIPHLIFDALYDFPAGYSHPEFSIMEIELISRCDIFCYNPEHLEISRGVRWEYSFAKWLNKEILTYQELIKK